MANNPLWSDDYWLLVMQLYMKKPAGVKSEYSRAVIELAIELHLQPKTLQEQMRALESHDTPSLQRLWDTYADNPKRLSRDVKRMRQMAGFGDAKLFYDGVETATELEHDYRPIDGSNGVMPVMLVIILQLYFTLTANTMVAETPEVAETARLLSLKAEDVVRVLEMFQTFDPILKRKPLPPSTLYDEAKSVWQRFYSEQPEQLENTVEKLKEYFA